MELGGCLVFPLLGPPFPLEPVPIGLGCFPGVHGCEGFVRFRMVAGLKVVGWEEPLAYGSSCLVADLLGLLVSNEWHRH